MRLEGNRKDQSIPRWGNCTLGSSWVCWP